MGLVVGERPVEDEFGKNHPLPSLRPTSFESVIANAVFGPWHW